MSLHDDLVDATTQMLGLRNAAEASATWPAIVRALERVRDGLERQRPMQRRSPQIDAAVDWCWRAVHDAPIAEADRVGALEVLSAIKAMVGPVAIDWRAPDPPKRRGRPEGAKSSHPMDASRPR